MSDRDDELFAAFRAGFDASGEGWNGEYPGDVEDADLKRHFRNFKRRKSSAAHSESIAAERPGAGRGASRLGATTSRSEA